MGDRRVTVSDGTCLIRLTGEIDFANADQLADWLFNQIDRVHCERVHLDLREVSLLDSSGIRTLVLTYRHAAGHGAKLRVVNPQPGVLRILRTTGVDELLGI
jgi:anti-sigma B factor antagonist